MVSIQPLFNQLTLIFQVSAEMFFPKQIFPYQKFK